FWLHPPSGPREGCEEFHDFDASSSLSPWRSWWPTIAEPWVLFAQLPHVRSSAPANAVPSGCEPVRISCMFGVSPRPFTISPFSVSAVCLLMLLVPCSSARLFARSEEHTSELQHP